MKNIDNIITQLQMCNDVVGKRVIYTPALNEHYTFTVKSVEVKYELIDGEIRCRGCFYLPTDWNELPFGRVFSTLCKPE